MSNGLNVFGEKYFKITITKVQNYVYMKTYL